MSSVYTRSYYWLVVEEEHFFFEGAQVAGPRPIHTQAALTGLSGSSKQTATTKAVSWEGTQ